MGQVLCERHQPESTTLVPVWLRQQAKERQFAEKREKCFQGESREEGAAG